MPARPVQHIAKIHRGVRIEMEPGLAAHGVRARVPGEAQGLPAIVKLDQVLLVDAERVFDFIIVQLAAGFR